MKVKLVQMNSVNGKFKENLAFMLSEIKETITHADVIVFPELCVSGSLIMDYFERTDIIHELLQYNLDLIDASHEIMVIWGNVDLHKDELLDSAFVAYKGELVYKTSKQFNSTSNLRHKKKYFEHSAQSAFKTFEAFGKVCSVVINNDIMVHDFNDVDVLFHLNSHYFRKMDSLEHKIQFISKLKPTVISVNGVGIVNAEKFFGVLDGQSLVYHNNSYYVLNSNFEVESHIVDLNNFNPNLNGQDIKLIDVLLFAIKQIDQEVFGFKPKWIVGLSGGLDSSVVAALLSMSLGKERVVGLNLPSKFNTQLTKDNANELAHKLGIEYHQINIMDLVNSTQSVLNQVELNAEGLAYENIQARIRGHVLMSYASMVNGVVSNNTNKIEMALGYGTMYGDTLGALGILGDCTKTDVLQLARDINERLEQEIIPTNLIAKETDSGLEWEFAPSAELKSNQVDPMKWGYHDAIILRLISEPNSLMNILNEYQDGRLLESSLGKYLRQYDLLDPKHFISDIKWLLNSISRNVFKRIQGVPFIVTSNCAIGLHSGENQMELIISDEASDLMKRIEEQ